MHTPVKKSIAKISIAVLTAALVLVAQSPVLAATPTLMKDTLDRLKQGVSATHSLSMTLPGAGITPANTGTLTVTYTGFGSDFAGPSVVVTCGVGGGSATFGTNVVTITSGSTACSGTLTVTPFTGTNPAAAGSKTITLGGNAGITGTFAIAIVSEDQVGVTASVDPSITFNVGAQDSGTACGVGFNGNGGTVGLGTLTTSAVTSSDAASVYHICTRVTTNAGSGTGGDGHFRQRGA